MAILAQVLVNFLGDLFLLNTPLLILAIEQTNIANLIKLLYPELLSDLRYSRELESL